MNSLFVQTELDEKIDALKCDPAKKSFILARLRMAEQDTNCNWRALGFDRKLDFERVLAAQNHCSVRTVQRCAQVLRRGDDLEELACDRPGPKRGEFKSLDADARAHLLDCFLFKHLNCRQSHRSVVMYLQTKQNSPGCQVSYFYDVPTYSKVKRYWREVLIPMYGPQRDGKEAVKTAAGYLDRLYDDEFAGDTWCLDEWEIDGAFYDGQDHRRIFNYGTGRPIVHILTILDERTTHIIDHLVTWQVSLEDAVFAVAERTIRQHFLPRRVVSDRAGRFRALVRGHMVAGRDGELIEKLGGPLGELGVVPRGSEEKNPRANRLERLHRLYADRARDFGPSWKPPLEKHEHREIDDAVDRHLNAHCRYGTIGPQLMSIQEGARRIAQWVEDINLADTEAKGCNGLTRLAAFRQFQPPADEIAQRKPNQAALDLAFAERDERAIREGGIIELEDGARYSCPQLIEWRLRLGSGVKIPVMRYRRDPLHLIVSPPGAEPFTAERRAIVGTKDEALLSDEIEKMAHIRKVVGGETAELDREMQEHLRSLQDNMRGLRARPMTIERAPTSADLAKQVLGLKD
ncbi:MAG: hypothetical protein ABSF71_22120 [Terriglobia bacterium]|jgi:hypothetical protein